MMHCLKSLSDRAGSASLHGVCYSLLGLHRCMGCATACWLSFMCFVFQDYPVDAILGARVCVFVEAVGAEGNAVCRGTKAVRQSSVCAVWFCVSQAGEVCVSSLLRLMSTFICSSGE